MGVGRLRENDSRSMVDTRGTALEHNPTAGRLDDARRGYFGRSGSGSLEHSFLPSS